MHAQPDGNQHESCISCSDTTGHRNLEIGIHNAGTATFPDLRDRLDRTHRISIRDRHARKRTRG
jgi:hypothetical protein